MPQWLVIGVSGVTCGGKTTLSHNLRDYFKSKQNAQLWQSPYTIGDVQLISQDDYFLPVDDRRHKWIEKLNAINFELLTSLDMKQMISDITWTMKGRYLANDPIDNNVEFVNDNAMMPPPPPQIPMHYHHDIYQQQHQQTNHYYQNHQHNHQQNQRSNHQQQQQHQQKQQAQQQQRHQHQHQHQHQQQQQQQRHSMRSIANNQSAAIKLRDYKVNILIIDGFMIFNQPELLTLCNVKFHFHLPYEKCYERRRKRVYDPPDVTGYFEMCVWPYYEKNFSEFRDRKDITILNGEICKERILDFVLQKIAKYVEERCDAISTSSSSSLSSSSLSSATTTTTIASSTIASTKASPPHKMIGIHSHHNNSNNQNAVVVAATATAAVVKPCPMEQQ